MLLFSLDCIGCCPVAAEPAWQPCMWLVDAGCPTRLFPSNLTLLALCCLPAVSGTTPPPPPPPPPPPGTVPYDHGGCFADAGAPNR